jgi:hypothetical protein
MFELFVPLLPCANLEFIDIQINGIDYFSCGMFASSQQLPIACYCAAKARDETKRATLPIDLDDFIWNYIL